MKTPRKKAAGGGRDPQTSCAWGLSYVFFTCVYFASLNRLRRSRRRSVDELVVHIIFVSKILLCKLVPRSVYNLVQLRQKLSVTSIFWPRYIEAVSERYSARIKNLPLFPTRNKTMFYNAVINSAGHTFPCIIIWPCFIERCVGHTLPHILTWACRVSEVMSRTVLKNIISLSRSWCVLDIKPFFYPSTSSTPSVSADSSSYRDTRSAVTKVRDRDSTTHCYAVRIVDNARPWYRTG